MKIVTIDASAAASWLFRGQRTRAADAFLEASVDRRFVAPGVFAWEIGNQIGIRARGDRREASRMLAHLDTFEIRIAPSLEVESVFGSIDQALRRNLTLFDTAYLTHSLMLGTSLASRDWRLLGAAVAAGVDVFDLRD